MSLQLAHCNQASPMEKHGWPRALHTRRGPLSRLGLEFLTGVEVLNADASALEGAVAYIEVIGCLQRVQSEESPVDWGRKNMHL